MPAREQHGRLRRRRRVHDARQMLGRRVHRWARARVQRRKAVYRRYVLARRWVRICARQCGCAMPSGERRVRRSGELQWHEPGLSSGYVQYGAHVQPRIVHPRAGDSARHVQRRFGDVPGGNARELRQLRLQWNGVRSLVHDGRGLRPGDLLRRDPPLQRQTSDRRGMHLRRPMRLDVLRGRRLLQRGVQRPMRSVQPRDPPGHVLAGNGRSRGPARALSRHGRHLQGDLQRHRHARLRRTGRVGPLPRGVVRRDLESSDSRCVLQRGLLSGVDADELCAERLHRLEVQRLRHRRGVRKGQFLRSRYGPLQVATPARRFVHAGSRVRDRTVRGQRLLRQRLHGTMRDVRGSGPRRDVRAGDRAARG